MNQTICDISKIDIAPVLRKLGWVRKWENTITGDTSDGYHTFNELYNHRVLLWINIVNKNISKAYLLKEHYDGWFLLGLETEFGQISYHCPNKYLELLDSAIKELPDDSNYDGHTSDDVVERLKKLSKHMHKK